MNLPGLAELAFVALPPLAALTAGLVATQRAPSPKQKSAILHLAAGVVFAVVAVELIPDLLHEHSPLFTALGFALGVVAMLAVKAAVEGKERAEAPKSLREAASTPDPARAVLPVAMLVAVAVDLAVDGLLLGIGFAAGAKTGRLLALALGTELVALGLAITSTLRSRGLSAGRALRVLSFVLTSFVAAAALGLVLLATLHGAALVVVLAFGSAALLFLVTEELLMEAHEEKEAPWMTAMFFLGFLAFLLLGMLS